MANLRKRLITGLKFAISAILIYFIFTKINLEEVLNTIQKARPGYLALAVCVFMISKVIAAFRLNIYFHRIKVFLTQKSNIKLYILGMFYNLFLPGGIGGDAYKGYLIKKKFGIETKKVVSVLVFDRLSGLLLLFIYACTLAIFLENERILQFKPLFIAGIILGILFFWILNKLFFDYLLPIFWKSFGLSAIVQLAQLISVFFILKSLGIANTITIPYLFIFLLSSIVSVLPLTIGGIGSREVTFFYGATLLGLDVNSSISISMLFFAITAVVSLVGIFYHFKRIDLETLQES